VDAIAPATRDIPTKEIPTGPPPLSLRAMMETFMTTQAVHG